ncbi:MAG TPA: GNAT family N-acetyltransferase [Acidimicrobiales bacterium]|nr:GNAT family N-acetyltransferase [Acidimicrobiales bacterium]
MRATAVRPGELGEAEIARWAALQEADPDLASPFLRPELAVAIDRHWPDTRVAVLEDGPDVVGFFAFHAGRLGAGRALGLGLTDGQGAVLAPGVPWDAGALRRASGLSVWEFDHLVPGQADTLAPRHAARHASPVMDLGDGVEAWAARRADSGRIKKARYHGRRLARQRGEVEALFDTRSHDDLALLMRWKSAQYRRTGRRDRFAQPAVAGLVRDLLDTRTDGFAAHLSALTVDGTPAALCLVLRSHHVLAHWFPAYDTELSRYQPGLVHLLEMVPLAAADGITLFDLGAGEHDYKDSFKDREVTVVSGTVHHPGPASWLHRARTGPPRAATDFVLAHPRLRLAARKALLRAGTARDRLSSRRRG